MNPLYTLAARLGCTIADAAKCLRSLAGNGRPDDLMALADATWEPTPAPPWDAEPTPLFDAALAYIRASLAELDALETYDDFLYVTGEDR